jgi:hypothetical protein
LTSPLVIRRQINAENIQRAVSKSGYSGTLDAMAGLLESKKLNPKNSNRPSTQMETHRDLAGWHGSNVADEDATQEGRLDLQLYELP